MNRWFAMVSLAPLLAGLLAPAGASAQCMLANPSFELTGSSGSVFAGWNQFGPVGSSPDATHGALAARASGPNTGNWDVAGFWQPQVTTPGRRWKASVRGWHEAAKPLSGQAQAILNIEWRNSSGALITYESHTVANAATPTGEVQDFAVESQAAPAGTATVRFLLGALQGPTDPAPDVFFDEARFEDAGPPTLESRQWSDFTGGRTVSFSGRTWRVKGPGFYGPGPNLFCNTASCLWVDASDRMHITVQQISGSWYSTEAVLEEALGYGDYVFTTNGRLDQLHPNVVLGLFLWQYGPCYDAAYLWWNPHNEIDVEFSRWGNPANDIAQFVAQPYDYPGNIHRFPVTFTTGEITSHAFRWLPDRIEYRSWRGGPEAESPGTLIRSWTYTGPHIPRPELPRVHVNLWQFAGPPTTTQEVVFEKFTFVPDCPSPPCLVDAPGVPSTDEGTRLAPVAWPNPFRGTTTIRFSVPGPGVSELSVYDVAGRHVRRLARGEFPAGERQVTWDGRDDAGRTMGRGIYFVRQSTGDDVRSRVLVYLR